MNQRTETWRWLLVSVFLLWIFGVLASFFAVQKPFSVANALAIGHALLDLLTVGWLALIALLAGAWFLQRLWSTGLPLAETLILGTGLGLGALGLLSLAVGLMGLFQPVVAYGVTIALSVVLAPQAVRFFHRYRHWRPVNRPGLFTILYLLLMALVTLLVALLPPVDWDGLFYHLTGPKIYLQSGRVVGDIDIPHLSFPALMEMLYAWAILLRGDIAAKLLHTLFGLLLAGLVYLTARRFLGQKSAWPAVLVLTSMPMISTLAGWAYNDLALAFYQLASLYSMINYQPTGQVLAISNDQTGKRDIQSPTPHPEPHIQNPASRIANSQFTTFGNSQPSAIRVWLILSGIFAGLAMGMKYTSFITPLVVGSLILWYAYRRSRFTLHAPRSTLPALRSPLSALRSTGLVDLATFVLVALLVALPWYVKNWAFTGNPVYPFLFGWFGGQYWDNFRVDWYAAAGTGIGFRPGTLLTLPWLLTLGIRDANYWDGRTGPLFLLFLPLILLYGFFDDRYTASRSSAKEQGGRPVALSPLLVYALAQFGFWTLGVVWSRSLWQSRLLLPGLVALAPVAGWIWAGLSRLDMPNFSLSRFTNLAIGLTLALTVIDTGLLTLKIDPLSYLTGLETREQYLTRRLGAYYAAMQQINEDLPAEAVVTFLWEPRSYNCQLDCRPDSILDEFPHLVDRYGSAEAIVQAWQQAGVTHVLIHRSGLNFILNHSPETIDTTVLTELETKAFRLVFDVAGAYQLYALEPDL